MAVLKGGVRTARERGESGSALAEALNDIGALYHNSGRFLEAERSYKQSLSLWARIPEPKPRMGIVLGNLAGLRLAQGRPSDAEKLFSEAKRILVAGYGAESPEIAFVLCGLADVYWGTRHYDDARLAAESALSTSEKLRLGAQTGAALFLLAKVAWRQNREEDAERLLRQAIDVWRTSQGQQHPTYASGLSSLAVVLSKKDPDESTRLFRESLVILEVQLGPDHAFTGYTLLDYSKHLKAQGRKKEGIAVERRGKAILNEHTRENFLTHTFDVNAFRK